MDWQQLLVTDVDNDEKICIGLQEQEQNIQQVLFKSLVNDVTQEMPPITLLLYHLAEENHPITNGTFKHLFSIRSVSCNSSLTKKPNKIIYAKLFGLSKKVIDSAIKVDINPTNITKHKGRPPKRLQSFVEQTSKGKHVSKIDINNNENAEGGSKGHKCRRCKQYGHYAKTCQTSMQ
ncbi:unnamed protein product [Rhizophagus irregularis]|nr:unnamed protein product [Rhizophagus irregularis]